MARGTIDGTIDCPTRLWIGKDCDVAWEDMKDGLTGEALVAASVNMKVRDDNEAVVIFPVTLRRDMFSVSTYRGTLDNRHTALLTNNNTYYLDVSATDGTSTGFRRISLKAATWRGRSFS